MTERVTEGNASRESEISRRDDDDGDGLAIKRFYILGSIPAIVHQLISI